MYTASVSYCIYTLSTIWAARQSLSKHYEDTSFANLLGLEVKIEKQKFFRTLTPTEHTPYASFVLSYQSPNRFVEQNVQILTKTFSDILTLQSTV